MKYVCTDFYLDFECIGGTCIDSCCIGWNVFVDESTYQLYSTLPDSNKNWICDKIEESNQSKRIVMGKDGRCPFLNEQNLCEIFIRVSPDAMSDVCKIYPRKILPYYDVILSTVTVSCPEVARILLTRKEPIAFEYMEDEKKVEIENADWSLYNELINGLVLTTDIIQNRELSFEKRVYIAVELTNIIQKHIEEGHLDVLRKNIECYKEEEYLIQAAKGLVETDIVGYDKTTFIKSLFQKVFIITQTGVLRTDLYGQLMDDINDMTNLQYEAWNAEYRMIEVSTEAENMAVEFIFEYYMDALKGENLFANVIKMCLLLLMIRTCEIVMYHKNGELLEEDKVRIVSKISKTMEHTPILEMVAKDMLSNNPKEVFYQLALLLY